MSNKIRPVVRQEGERWYWEIRGAGPGIVSGPSDGYDSEEGAARAARSALRRLAEAAEDGELGFPTTIENAGWS